MEVEGEKGGQENLRQKRRTKRITTGLKRTEVES